MASKVQRGVRNNSAPADVSAEIVRDRRAIDREACAGQRLKRRAQRRIADKVVRPGDATAQDERDAADKGRCIEAAADLGANVGGVHRRIRKAEPGASDIGLAVCRRVEVLELNRTIRCHAKRR